MDVDPRAQSASRVRGQRPRIRFDRHECAGAFGDIGTDLPLIVGMVLAVGLDAASVFIMFGLMQILTGVLYRLPMPVQPLKAMAVLVITQRIEGSVLYGAGLAIGVLMLALTLSGGLSAFVRLVPLPAVRGVQFGLGLSLASLALRDYVRAEGIEGYVLGGIAFAILLALMGNRRVPGGLVVISLGAVYALMRGFNPDTLHVDVRVPIVDAPGLDAFWTGLLVLALPQLPLSLSNSVVATRQTLADLFPDRRIGVRRIGLTYSMMNLIAPWFGGIPVCHGCGGIAGHHAFGGRTGGSVVLYGLMYVGIGMFLSSSLEEAIRVFPRPILGVVLLFEAIALLMFIRDQASDARALRVALLTGVIALTLPQGYLVGLIVGSVLWWAGGEAK